MDADLTLARRTRAIIERQLEAGTGMREEPALSVEMVTAYVPVNLDSDGTPLSLHGERMTEIEPGKWADPLLAEVIAFIGRHPLPEAGP